jgi:hypothetical protein
VAANAFVEFLDGRYEHARALYSSTLETWRRGDDTSTSPKLRLGASDSLRRQAGLALWDPRDLERTEHSLRRTLGADAFETLWQIGSELTREHAIELARIAD